MSGEMTPEEEEYLEQIIDGLALWDEHRPQSSEDWIAVAERCLADPSYDRERSSVMFRALVIAVEERDAACTQLDRGDASELQLELGRVLGTCPHGVDLDRAFCPKGCRV